MDEVSSYGYAWGYLGSCIPFLVALIAYVFPSLPPKVLPNFPHHIKPMQTPAPSDFETLLSDEEPETDHSYYNPHFLLFCHAVSVQHRFLDIQSIFCMKVGKIICKTPVFPSFHDPPEISQQIISISQINAGVCAKTERIAITAKITAAATAAIIIFLFITYLLSLSCFRNILFS